MFLFGGGPSTLTLDFRLPDASSLAAENVRRLSVSLYAELLSRLVSFINRSIRPTTAQPATIILVDSPGFQNPSTVGRAKGAGSLGRTRETKGQ